jgi:hypothetical protein
MSLADVEFKDFSIKVKAAMNDIAPAVLEEVAGELESQVKRNTVVDTGQTKNSWTHNVRSSKDQHTATVGSPLQNAIWEEFGTGDYALNGNGRKGGWFYVDERGKGHFTHGKHPRRPFWKAYTALKNRIIKRIQDAFKGGLS